MRSHSRMTAAALVGGLVLLCASSLAQAQSAAQVRPITHIASIAAGSIQGTVLDEQGVPVVGAMVSALGATTAFALSDRSGRFELRTLSPGPYLVRAHLTGFVASRGQVIDVRPSGRASSSIALRHVGPAVAVPVLAASLSGSPESPAAPVDPVETGGTSSTAGSGIDDDHGALAWRLRHA